MSCDRKVVARLNGCIKNNEPVAMITIIGTDGSTPRGIGSAMLMNKYGNLLEGTIGGGVLEERLKKEAIDCIGRNESKMIEYKLDSSDRTNALSMTCGGNISLFIKVYNTQEKFIIAGAGHVSEKVAKLADFMGYRVVVMDNRKERLNHDIFSDSIELMHCDIVENLKNMDIDMNTLVIIVTHGHEYDQDALETVLGSNAKYIGMIGSISKIKICFRNLIDKGYTKEELLKVYTPIGIRIGGETPEEIALSIMAEVQSLKYGMDVPHLSDIESKF